MDGWVDECKLVDRWIRLWMWIGWMSVGGCGWVVVAEHLMDGLVNITLLSADLQAAVTKVDVIV